MELDGAGAAEPSLAAPSLLPGHCWMVVPVTHWQLLAPTQPWRTFLPSTVNSPLPQPLWDGSDPAEGPQQAQPSTGESSGPTKAQFVQKTGVWHVQRAAHRLAHRFV